MFSKSNAQIDCRNTYSTDATHCDFERGAVVRSLVNGKQVYHTEKWPINNRQDSSVHARGLERKRYSREVVSLAFDPSKPGQNH